MVASAPLLEFALLYAKGSLADYYRRHLEQERGHDLMLLNDLKAMGVHEVPHYHTAAQVAGAQYYFIAHDHPALLLGYMYVLENAAPDPERVRFLEAMHGAELTCVRHHANVDRDHVRELTAVIDTLPADLQARVTANGVMTTNLLQLFLDHLWAQTHQEAA